MSETPSGGSAAPPGSTASIEVQAAKMLIEQLGVERAADFIVRPQEAVDGLSSNNRAFAESFQILLAKQYRLESSLRELIQAMHDYEMNVDVERPAKHIRMMERAELALQ